MAVTDVGFIESYGPTDAVVPPFLCEAANRSASRGSGEEVDRCPAQVNCF